MIRQRGRDVCWPFSIIQRCQISLSLIRKQGGKPAWPVAVAGIARIHEKGKKLQYGTMVQYEKHSN